MSIAFELQIDERSDLGKGAIRRIRREQDLVPAVIYGGKGKPRSVTVQHKDLRKLLENEASFSRVLALKDQDGGEEQVILQALQRHPARDLVLHADFLRVAQTSPISVPIPLHFVNVENCIGVRQGGGTVTRKASRVRIRCLSAKLPEYIEVDMAHVDVRQSVRLSDLHLPDGVEIPQLRKGSAYNIQVAAVNPPRGGTLAVDE